MNEKIKKLSRQAFEYAYDAGIPISTYIPMSYTKKFAELIIEECSNLTLDYKSDQHYAGWIEYRDAIKRHFGVNHE